MKRFIQLALAFTFAVLFSSCSLHYVAQHANTYPASYEYWYYPEYHYYYDTSRQLYFYPVNNGWAQSSHLPVGYSTSTEHVVVNVASDKPYVDYPKHRQKYLFTGTPSGGNNANGGGTFDQPQTQPNPGMSRENDRRNSTETANGDDASNGKPNDRMDHPNGTGHARMDRDHLDQPAPGTPAREYDNVKKDEVKNPKGNGKKPHPHGQRQVKPKKDHPKDQDQAQGDEGQGDHGDRDGMKKGREKKGQEN